MRARSLGLAFAAGLALAFGALALRARWSEHERAQSRASEDARESPAPLAPERASEPASGPVRAPHVAPPPSAPPLAPGARLGSAESAPVPRVERAFELEVAELGAERVLRVRGAEITRAELDVQLALGPGAGLVEARCLAAWGLHAAQSRGLPFGFDDAAWRAYLDAWAELRGHPPESAEQLLAAASGLPPQAALLQRRDLISGLLAFLDLRVAQAAAQPTSAASIDGFEAAEALLPQYARARAELAQPGRMRELVTLLDVLALVAQPLLRAELEPRIFSAFDCELPPGVAAGIDLGPRSSSESAPWQSSGPRATIESAPIVAVLELEGEHGHAQRASSLRELVSLRALRAVLEEAGVWAEDAADWRAWRTDLLDSRGALLGLDAQGALFAGMPSPAHQRAYARIRRAQRRLPSARPASEDELRSFWAENRALVERWPIELELALFPPRQLASQSPDWRAAHERAAEFAAQLARADADERAFERRAEEFARELEAGLGAQAALDWRERGGNGRLRLDAFELERWLQENRWQRVLWGSSCARAVFAQLALGEASPAWRTPLGWIVVRPASAAPPPEPRDFESVRAQAQAALEEARWLAWVDAALAAARIEPVR